MCPYLKTAENPLYNMVIILLPSVEKLCDECEIRKSCGYVNNFNS